MRGKGSRWQHWDTKRGREEERERDSLKNTKRKRDRDTVLRILFDAAGAPSPGVNFKFESLKFFAGWWSTCCIFCPDAYCPRWPVEVTCPGQTFAFCKRGVPRCDDRRSTTCVPVTSAGTASRSLASLWHPWLLSVSLGTVSNPIPTFTLSLFHENKNRRCLSRPFARLVNVDGGPAHY